MNANRTLILSALRDAQKRFGLHSALDDYAIRNEGFDAVSTRIVTFQHFLEEHRALIERVSDIVGLDKNAVERNRAQRLLSESAERYFDALADDDRRNWYRQVYATEFDQLVHALIGGNQ